MNTKAKIPRAGMRIQWRSASLLSLALAGVLCFPPAASAQNAGQPPQSPAPLAPAAQSSSQDQQPTPGQKQPSTSTAVKPSPAPLQPVTTYPDAAGNPQAQAPAMQNAGASQAPQTEPQGAATAEKVPTAGGAAAKPAGAAIAPAKQHQARSLLIKLGAVAAGAVAAGTIYGLSKGTPSTPPGSNTPGAVQKR